MSWWCSACALTSLHSKTGCTLVIPALRTPARLLSRSPPLRLDWSPHAGSASGCRSSNPAVEGQAPCSGVRPWTIPWLPSLLRLLCRSSGSSVLSSGSPPLASSCSLCSSLWPPCIVHCHSSPLVSTQQPSSTRWCPWQNVPVLAVRKGASSLFSMRSRVLASHKYGGSVFPIKEQL